MRLDSDGLGRELTTIGVRCVQLAFTVQRVPQNHMQTHVVPAANTTALQAAADDFLQSKASMQFNMQTL